MKNNQNLLAVALVLFAVVSRILCAELGAFNFAPVIAIGLVSGILVKDSRYAFLIAILGQFIADVYFQLFPLPGFTGFYGISQFFVYAGILVASAIGRLISSVSLGKVFGGTLAASIIFFALSNLGVFASGYNGYTFGGLTKTYIDAIPFFKASLQADMIGSAIIFGAYFAIKATLPKLKTA